MPPPARNGWATRAGLAAGPSRAAAARPAATGGQRRREVRTLLGDCARAAAMWPSLLRRASLRHGRAGKEAGPAAPSSIRGHSAPVCAQRLETARLADLAPLYQPTPLTLSSLAPATGPHISHPSRLLSILSQLLFLPLLLQFPPILYPPPILILFPHLSWFFLLPRLLLPSTVIPYSFSSPQPPSCPDLPASSSPCSRSCPCSSTSVSWFGRVGCCRP